MERVFSIVYTVFMCGINGFIGKNQEKIEKMNLSLNHRGPDFSGYYVSNEISLGHTLLSIREATDLSKQPYSKQGSPWILLFNGQIYNTESLKNDLPLEYKNVDLDTAILYEIILKYGWNFIERIHGMYAIALYNIKESTLRLYRDPSGQKNLYYFSEGNNFIFSSEIKGILSHNITKETDAEGVLLSVNFGYTVGNKTIYKSISKLLPSEEITFNLNNKTISKRLFKSGAENYYENNEEDAFEKLIKEHVLSKQRLAINLSGGLDSSILLHELSKRSSGINTYSTSFTESSDYFNEDSVLAKKLANDYGATHTEIEVTKKDYFEAFITSYKIIEEPNYNISLPTYFLTAKKEGIRGDNNRVILSGDGGDELFGGYEYYLKSAKIRKIARLISPFIFNLIKNRRNGTNLDYMNEVDRWIFFKRFYERHILNDEDFTKESFEYVHKLIKYYSTSNDAVYRSMLCDRYIWLPNENFIRTDKLYMHESLEMRSPLSYHPFRIYFDQKLSHRDYISETNNKIFLRKYATGKLPEYITARKRKSGWRAPIELWYDNKFKELFLEIVRPMKNNRHLINWASIYNKIEKEEKWPGKYIHLYLSLAILATEHKLDI